MNAVPLEQAVIYRMKLAKALERAGGLYELSDILERVADGRMQAHVSRETIAVTEVSVYPRRRVLTMILLAGDLADGEDLHEQVLSFARKLKCDAIIAQGRVGWARLAKSHGWKTVSQNMVFRKEVSP
jgi:hypothetical protein